MSEGISYQKGDKIKAVKSGGRSSNLDVRSRSYIGEGGNGVIDRVHIAFESGDRNREFVVKRYVGHKPTEKAEKAIRAYDMLKDAGLKNIPGTFRLIVPEKDSILMTNYNTASEVAFSMPQNKAKEAEGIKIDQVINLDEVIPKLDEDILRASESELIVHHDAYFVQVPRSGGAVAIKVFIVDLDGVSRIKGSSPTELYRENVSQLYRALTDALWGRFTHKKDYNEFRLKLTDWKDEAISTWHAWKKGVEESKR